MAGKFVNVEKRAMCSLLLTTCDAPADSWVVLATAIVTCTQHYEEWQALLDTICEAEKEAFIRHDP